jgi:hypothetical protein
MITEPQDEKAYPTERLVVNVIDAAGGGSEDEVLRCLSYFREQRGLKPGTKNGPRRFSWFPVVVGEYFQRQRERQYPPSAPDVQLSKERLDSWRKPPRFDAQAARVSTPHFRRP